MGKARIAPLYFDPGRDTEFDRQVEKLIELVGDLVEITTPLPLGSPITDAEAVILPQVLGEAYRQLETFKDIQVPILIVTTEFGTLAMWDWEIISWLSAHGVRTIAPYSLEMTRTVCRSLNAKADLRNGSFLVFQDNPGLGFQPSIFKRFLWWEDESVRRLRERFGVTVVRKSFEQLGSAANQIQEKDAEAELKKKSFAHEGLSSAALVDAIKLYMAVRTEIDADPSIRGVGINCLNESHFSTTTPCLAWNLLYQERRMIWACEADTLSLATKYLINLSLDVPVIMSNIYPFLMGQAALSHERIPSFPPVEGNPDNHILMAHCGYLGVCPQCFAAPGQWKLRSPVLEIVNKNAHAIDARLPIGPCTLVKLDPMLERLMAVEGQLTGYVQYKDSDCLNGAIIEVADGHQFMRTVYSHHQCIMVGHRMNHLHAMTDAIGLELVTL